MDKDLEKLQQEIANREAGKRGEENNPSSSSTTKPEVFNNAPAKVEQPSQAPATQQQNPFDIQVKKPEKIDQVGEVVEGIFTQAVGHVVATDDTVKQDMLDTAKKVINDKVETIKNDAEKDSKASYFNNNKDACGIFGYDETTTAKSHVKIMSVWAYILNTIYIFTIGMFIVAPICFICKKVKVFVKHAWVAILLAVLIYLGIILIPLLIGLLSGGNSTAG